MKRVLLEGSLAYDQILQFSGKFQDNLDINLISSSYFCSGYSFNFGGTAGNIAYGIGLLGNIEVDICSVLGGIDADTYLNRIKQWGVLTSGIQVVENSKSATACICTDNIEQQLTFFFPGPLESAVVFNPSFKEYDLACISANYASLMLSAMDFCIGGKIPFIFDPGQQIAEIVKSSRILELIAKCYILILNKSEFEFLISNLNFTKEQLFELTENVVITNGDNAIEVSESFGKVLGQCKINAVKALDPTGAGDSFRAALIWSLLNDTSLVDSVKFASDFALKCINTYGPQDYS
jgi:adenosine kinase